ncbi:SLC13 family permease [Capnocytophaga catalasegens]|uniref:Transporter n=1 Tax=Capnocytophaga catalasegens TaxID=1004260 RepID=A0AAV5AZK3_9FLAO|nr:DASS family sodium-coupled anion symporter [Capnocytophaga catalasegens]GIZ15474.1 transporter [Capnocytophaga catalasegens]GJM51062.1 transporter [Capnocytophaga catalasegens]GJM52247.1 transporter [Capnocytophaga catalasegens]
MADSRHYSLEIMSHIQRMVDVQRKVIYFLLSAIVAFGLTYFLYEPELNRVQIYVLFLLFFAIGLWITEAIPPFATGLLVFGFLIFATNSYYSELDPENAKSYYQDYVNTWSNSVIWLMLGGFFMADAMQRTHLDRIVFKMSISKFGTAPQNILLGLMLTTAAFSTIMSNTATTAMMAASVAPFLQTLPKDAPLAKAILIGIAAAASIGGMGTLIGSPPNAIAVDALSDKGIGFLEWMYVGMPIAIILVFVAWYLLKRKYIKTNIPVEVTLDETPTEEELKEDPQILKMKKNIVLIVLCITLLLWLTEKLHNIPASIVSFIPIMLLTMLGVVRGKDVRKLPWDTLMLVAGGLALGMAIKETGLAQHYVDKIQHLNLNFYVLILFFALLTVLLSNVMSNTATATILIPIAIILTYQNPIILPLVIGLSASTALFLPISTPPNAIAYSTGFLEQKDFRYMGIVIGIIGPIIICALTMLIFMVIL